MGRASERMSELIDVVRFCSTDQLRPIPAGMDPETTRWEDVYGSGPVKKEVKEEEEDEDSEEEEEAEETGGDEEDDDE